MEDQLKKEAQPSTPFASRVEDPQGPDLAQFSSGLRLTKDEPALEAESSTTRSRSDSAPPPKKRRHDATTTDVDPKITQQLEGHKRRNRDYRKRQSDKVALGKELKDRGEPLPPDIEAALQKKEKLRKRQREAVANKRRQEKERRMKEGERLPGPPSIAGVSGPEAHEGTHPTEPEVQETTPVHVPAEKCWLEGLMEMWDGGITSDIKALHTVGSIILNKLASLPNPLPSVPNDETLMTLIGKPTRGDIPPTLRLVRNDVTEMNNPNFVEYLSRKKGTGINGLDILLSITNLLTKCDMNTPERRLYGALDVRFGDNGIKLCKYEATPYENQQGCIVNSHQWTITLTPPAAITDTHMDYYGRQQYFVHLFGRKLWLLWPPSKKNLDIYGKYHTQVTPADLTSKCIDELEGLQVFYTTTEQAFILRPNVLHACISFSLCSHVGTCVWNLEEYKASLSMVDWGLDWLKGKIAMDAPISHYKEELNTISDEIGMWKHLIEDNLEQGKSNEANWELKRLENKYSSVKKLFK